MDRQAVQAYYRQPDIQRQLMSQAVGREVIPRFAEAIYRRPDVLTDDAQLAGWVDEGMTSIHGSIEHYTDPMLLDEQAPERIRLGWDLLIDIDARHRVGDAQLVAATLADILDEYEVPYGLKFSGNRGFHLMVPTLAMPDTVENIHIAQWFPQLLQITVRYLKDLIEPHVEMIFPEAVWNFVEVEENWSRRHLFRLAYSLHEDSWLVSAPVRNIEVFTIEDMAPERVDAGASFMPQVLVDEDGAIDLLYDALFQHRQNERERQERRRQQQRQRVEQYEPVTDRVDEAYFPEPIKEILSGLGDGRKRSTFTLIAFLRQMNYGWGEIDGLLESWNQRNDPPLPRSYVRAQLRWHQRRGRDYMPPNYTDSDFWSFIRSTDDPDYRNPVPSAIARYRQHE